MEKAIEYQYRGVQFLCASLVSLGLLFAWATGVALKILRVGYGVEPALFTGSVTLILSLLGLAIGFFLVAKHCQTKAASDAV